MRPQSAVRAGRLAVLVTVGALATPAAANAVVGGGGGGTTFTTSTFDHSYDLYYGTLTVTRTGEATPLSTRDGFSAELRVDQDAAQAISTALGGDPRIAAGFAGTAPDGGTWFTDRPRPDWIRFPNGNSSPESEPTFNAQSEYQRQIDPGTTEATCTDSATDSTFRGDDFVVGAWTSQAVGPGTIMIGEQRSQSYFVAAGTTNFNTETNYLVLDAHRIDRTCVLPAAEDLEPAPDPAKACKTEKPTISGTKKNDTLTGTDGPDVIFAGEGNDKVTGLGGRDILCLGPGNDKGTGGDGNDALNGSKGSDSLGGDAGNDNVFGSTGHDKVVGDLGNDLVNGGPTDGDSCDGGEGTDTTNRGCEKKASIP